MREHPIIFSGTMMHAILVGKKTMTRRVIGLYTMEERDASAYRPLEGDWSFYSSTKPGIATIHRKCPYGRVGDRLWVRESFALLKVAPDIFDTPIKTITQTVEGGRVEIRYAATSRTEEKWRPSIHMPRWASRIILEITDIRVERLQEMSQADCAREGIGGVSFDDVVKNGCPAQWGNIIKKQFQEFWDSINAKRGFGWSVNPLVWVIEFKKVKI